MFTTRSLLALSLVLVGCRSTDPDPVLSRMLGNIEFLASDELRGRSLGTSEGRRTADYLAERLREVGVRPAGGNGTYFHGFPVFEVEEQGRPRVVLEGSGDDYDVPRKHFEVASYGAAIPGSGLDIVQVLGPRDLPDEAAASVALATEYGNPVDEWVEALPYPDFGGLGALLLLSDQRRKSGATGAGFHHPWSNLEVPSTVRLFGPAARRVRSGEYTRLTLDPGARLLRHQERNVVGMVEGTTDEVVVFSAHYDHLAPDTGLCEGVYNGANDNASGCAVLLEVARAVSHGPRPRRTAIFLFTAAEERGQNPRGGVSWGSGHWLEHSGAQDQRILGSLNLEMLGVPKLVEGGARVPHCLTGWERSTLGPQLRAQGVTIVGEDNPYYLKRPENGPFHRAGIIAHTLRSGDEQTKHFHAVTDEVKTLYPDHLRASADLAITIARLMVDGTVTPTQPGRATVALETTR